jgi:hypothetical protein
MTDLLHGDADTAVTAAHEPSNQNRGGLLNLSLDPMDRDIDDQPPRRGDPPLEPKLFGKSSGVHEEGRIFPIADRRPKCCTGSPRCGRSAVRRSRASRPRTRRARHPRLVLVQEEDGAGPRQDKSMAKSI